MFSVFKLHDSAYPAIDMAGVDNADPSRSHKCAFDELQKRLDKAASLYDKAHTSTRTNINKGGGPQADTDVGLDCSRERTE